jgi:hypothetical protein
MDVDVIRSRFIQESLRRVLHEQDRERAARAVRALQLYFQWFEHRFPDMEKLSILSQLSKLEEAYAEKSRENSVHPDGVRHNLQETGSL